MTMPERIWANDFDGAGCWFTGPATRSYHAERTEYRRADLAAAQDARIAELEAALRWYADSPKPGEYSIVDDKGGFVSDFASWGKRARDALGDAP